MFHRSALSALTLAATATLVLGSGAVVASTASATAKSGGYQSLSQAQLHSPSGPRRAGGHKH